LQAEEIAQKIVESVGSSLEGKRLSSFTSVATFVRTAVQEALAGVLNKRQIDILADIQKAK
jgi:signal recognition particle receptor subunit alpha